MSYRTADGATSTMLDLAEDGAAFVVFRKDAAAPAAEVAAAQARTLAPVTGPWTVAFRDGRGALAGRVSLPPGSLADSRDPAIRYFSGESRWSRTITVARLARPGARMWLDLGQVGDVAEVYVNGTSAGIAWKAPYRVDITALARRGANRIEVKVANLWVNRLIGDAQPGATKIVYTSLPTYEPTAPLRPAGLLGPVRLVEETAAP